MTDLRGKVINNETIIRGRRIIYYLYPSKDHAVDFTDDDNFYIAINAKVNVAKVGAYKCRHGFTLESLPQKWFISPETASRTVQHTIQQDISMILHPSLTRKFKTNDQAPRYNRLQHSVFADTMQAGTVSGRVNLYAQVYPTDFF